MYTFLTNFLNETSVKRDERTSEEHDFAPSPMHLTMKTDVSFIVVHCRRGQSHWQRRNEYETSMRHYYYYSAAFPGSTAVVFFAFFRAAPAALAVARQCPSGRNVFSRFKYVRTQQRTFDNARRVVHVRVRCLLLRRLRTRPTDAVFTCERTAGAARSVRGLSDVMCVTTNPQGRPSTPRPDRRGSSWTHAVRVHAPVYTCFQYG